MTTDRRTTAPGAQVRPPAVAAAAAAADGARRSWQPQPLLPADTLAKRMADRLLLRGLLPRQTYVALTAFAVAGTVLASLLPTRPGLVGYAGTAFVVGVYCSLNVWRCRAAHCLVTGPGYLLYGALASVEAGLGRSLVGGYEGPIFLALFAVAVLFEAGWRIRRGTSVLR